MYVILEANPRASRTVPFVSKATGVPLAKAASRVMVGATLAELRAEGLLRPPADGGHIAVKEAVLPFDRFPDVDTVLGPEMRSTGEVMGIDRSFGLAFAKSQTAAGNRLPATGHGVLLARRSRQARRDGRGAPLRRARASRSSPPPAPRPRSRPRASSSRRSSGSSRPRRGDRTDSGGVDAVELLSRARSTWS